MKKKKIDIDRIHPHTTKGNYVVTTKRCYNVYLGSQTQLGGL